MYISQYARRRGSSDKSSGSTSTEKKDPSIVRILVVVKRILKVGACPSKGERGCGLFVGVDGRVGRG